jgi:hypothetical protein
MRARTSSATTNCCCAMSAGIPTRFSARNTLTSRSAGICCDLAISNSPRSLICDPQCAQRCLRETVPLHARSQRPARASCGAEGGPRQHGGCSHSPVGALPAEYAPDRRVTCRRRYPVGYFLSENCEIQPKLRDGSRSREKI